MSIASIGLVVCLLAAIALLCIFIAIPLIEDVMKSGEDDEHY